MMTLIEYRKEHPYDRRNQIGQSLEEWKYQTKRRWQMELLNELRNDDFTQNKFNSIVIEILESMVKP